MQASWDQELAAIQGQRTSKLVLGNQVSVIQEIRIWTLL
jgi:hypothetical protein